MNRLLLRSLLVVACAGATAGALLAQASVPVPFGAPTIPYALTNEARFSAGCLPPCLCAISTAQLTGTFDLTLQVPTSQYQAIYDLTNIQWQYPTFGGATQQVTGSGIYTIGGQIITRHYLALDLSINGGPVTRFESRVTTEGAAFFPRIQLDAAENNFFCFDRVWSVVAEPALATSFCLSATNSTGLPALISASGSVSIGANDLVLSALPAPPGMPGIFYFGSTQTQIPFGNGFRCVGGPGLTRLGPVVNANVGLEMRLNVDNTAHQSGALFAAGATYHFQCWFRDGAGGGAGFNLSDAMSVTFVP